MDFDELLIEVRLIRQAQEIMAKDVTIIKDVMNDPASGIVGRVKVLEASESREKWHFAGIWTLIGGLIAGLVTLARGH